MTKFRGFIAIDIASLPKLIEFENKIKDIGANVKLVEPKNVHITLKFLGDIEEEKIDEVEEIMKTATEGMGSFDIKLKGTGAFPNQNYMKVIWIGIEGGEQISVIADKIDEDLSKIGFEREKRKFSAHLTIGRVRSAKNKDQLIQIIEKYKEFEFADMKVDSIKLNKTIKDAELFLRKYE